MKVLVSVASGTLWQRAVSQFGLAHAGNCTELAKFESKPVLVKSVLTVEDISNLLKRYANIEMVVVYEGAEAQIATMHCEGIVIEQACERWKLSTEALLTLQQQHRRQLKLLNLHALTEPSSVLPDWLSFSPSSENLSGLHTIYTVIAAQALRQNHHLYALQQRLFASSLPVTEQQDLVFDLEQIKQQLAENEELEHTRSERDLLLLQLQHLQEELEQLFYKKTEVKQLYDKLQDSYQRDAEVLQTKIQDGENKVKATTKQLSSLQHELERLTDAHNTTYAQLKQITEQRDALLKQTEHDLPALRKNLEKAQAQLKQTEEENHLLLQQLQYVQEQLEQYYLRLQSEQQKNNHAIAAKDKQQQREISKLESQLRINKAKAASAEHKAQLLQQELKAVKGSVLWKSAAPVRVLSRMVNKTDKAKQKLQQDTALILTSEYFDLEWYLATYPDVANSNINPAEHYLRFGAAEGRMPGPLFDGNWYLQRYPDVASVNINPLLHFVKFGQQEGRSASPKLLTDNSQPKEE